ncbi:MAG TPA: Holliday junction resolvase RuvX [Steroidobacteraceae bacterium]|jgi:putative Holliday junction resolvase
MPEARAQVVLAFDFGLRRIGIACGDTISSTAAPRGAIPVTDRGVDWSAIDRLLRELRPDVLVVGSPRHADGTRAALGSKADRFASDLAARAQRAVQRTDEFASSIEAAERLKRKRASGERRRRVQHADIDGAAAAIILERWLRGEGRTE